MLIEKYRTLNIQYENHTDLLNSHFAEATAILEKQIQSIEKRIRRNIITENCYTTVRLRKDCHLIVCTFPKKETKIFLMRTNNNAFTFDISGTDFKNIVQPHIQYDLEDKCKNIGKHQYFRQQDTISKKIENIINDEFH